MPVKNHNNGKATQTLKSCDCMKYNNNKRPTYAT